MSRFCLRCLESARLGSSPAFGSPSPSAHLCHLSSCNLCRWIGVNECRIEPYWSTNTQLVCYTPPAPRDAKGFLAAGRLDVRVSKSSMNSNAMYFKGFNSFTYDAWRTPVVDTHTFGGQAGKRFKAWGTLRARALSAYRVSAGAAMHSVNSDDSDYDDPNSIMNPDSGAWRLCSVCARVCLDAVTARQPLAYMPLVRSLPAPLSLPSSRVILLSCPRFLPHALLLLFTWHAGWGTYRGVWGDVPSGRHNLTIAVDDAVNGMGHALKGRRSLQVSTDGMLYQFTGHPRIVNVSQARSGLGGGAELVIRGSGFSWNAADNRVTIGAGAAALDCPVTSSTMNELRCTLPAASASSAAVGPLRSAGRGLVHRVWYNIAANYASRRPDITMTATGALAGFHLNDADNYAQVRYF